MIARIGSALERARPAWHALTPVGRSAVFVAVGAWIAGVELGWRELFLVAACCTIALAIAAGFVVGRPTLSVTIELEPSRVTVGTPAAGRMVAANRSHARLRPIGVEIPIGASRAVFDLPSLARDEEHEELFVIPTTRRAVIPVGPPHAVRTDPLGLLRRDAVEQAVTELFVHPVITPLESLGAGLQRDLEGQTTRDLSTSDLAFHTLRDYVTGDDRRFVHWRSSAKAGKLLVRQFQDTRRSRLSILVDGTRSSYRTEDEFEIAMSVAGSIGVRAARDQHDVAVIAAGHATNDSEPRRILDTLARGEMSDDEGRLIDLAARAARIASDTTVLTLITGSVIPFSELRRCSSFYGPEVKVYAIRVEADEPPGLTSSGGMTVLAVRELSDLPVLLNAAVNA